MKSANHTAVTIAKPITSPDYWEGIWKGMDARDSINILDDAPENHYYQALHKLFVHSLGAHCLPGARLIEIGCGGSSWLPYFHREFGYAVSGIDYTEKGVNLSRLILDKAKVSGQIIHGDLFDPPADLIEQFEVVVSFGLVEHFENTAQAIFSCARYLQPGGQMISLVPTMRGLYGAAYRLLRPTVYRKHVPQSREMLAQAHSDAGLTITHSSYLLGLPGIISVPTTPGLFGRMAFAASRMYWRLERSGFGIPPNGFTSPYAICVATKPIRATNGNNENVVG